MEKSDVDKIQKSISTIYSELLQKRRDAKEAKREERRLAEEEKMNESSNDQSRPMTRKEKRAAQFESWKEVLVGLTGDDLDYVSPKGKKKKYKKWIGDETENMITTAKAKKKKKRNYNKEFAPELNMLKTIVSDQNKFVQDLQKRYQNSAGPNTKDAMPLNKTLVELAAVVNNSRGNSLALLREIGNIKKTIADLYMKQRKLDSELGGINPESQDLGLVGSSLASDIFGLQGNAYREQSPVALGDTKVVQQASTQETTISDNYDPSSWDGGGLVDDVTKYETMDKSIVVEWHKSSNKARFKAIDNSTGEEILGCPVPTSSIKAIDPVNKVAKDDFDQVYKIHEIE